MITREELLEHIQRGERVESIAKKYDRCAESIYRLLRKYELSVVNHRWSKQDDQYLRFHAYHKSQAVMAKHLGVSIYALRNRLYKLQLTAQRCIGYTSGDVARDTATDPRIVITWARKYGLPARHAAHRLHIDHAEFCDWLAAGNVLRIQDIKHAARFVQDIYADARARYITSTELHAICAVATYRIVHRPEPLMQVDEGYVYDRDTMADYLAMNVYLLYAGARGTYPDLIRMRSRAYVHGSDIAAYSESVYRSMWHGAKRSAMPQPVRTRPNVWHRDTLITWLRANAHNPKWAALLEYLDGIYQKSETR